MALSTNDWSFSLRFAAASDLADDDTDCWLLELPLDPSNTMLVTFVAVLSTPELERV